MLRSTPCAITMAMIGQLPESEMKEVRLFAQLPDNLTYPAVTPKLMREALDMYLMLHPEEA